MEMRQLKHDLLTNKYTEVWHEKEFNFNAPHNFSVVTSERFPDEDGEGEHVELLQKVHFQEGPVRENGAGVNGVNNEDLIAMVICRLEHFNQSEFRCRENSMAITKLEEALLWLRKRTMGREQRGIEGTHVK